MPKTGCAWPPTAPAREQHLRALGAQACCQARSLPPSPLPCILSPSNCFLQNAMLHGCRCQNFLLRCTSTVLMASGRSTWRGRLSAWLLPLRAYICTSLILEVSPDQLRMCSFLLSGCALRVRSCVCVSMCLCMHVCTFNNMRARMACSSG